MRTRALRVRLDFAAQSADQHVDASVERPGAFPDQRVEQVSTAQNSSGMTNEFAKQRKFVVREGYIGAIRPGERASIEIKGKRRKLNSGSSRQQ